MTRSVTALYDTRAEAEVARARLAAEADAERVQVLGRDDAARLDRMGLSADDARAYRQALGDGSVLLIAEGDAKANAERIVTLLKGAAAGSAAATPPTGRGAHSAVGEGGGQARVPQDRGHLWIGKRELVPGGARVRTTGGEQKAEDIARLREEQIHAGTGLAGRHLTPDEVQAAGLLKDRVVEVSAMREEAVVTKQVAVREEIILKKTTTQRVQTIHDTVRSTEVEIEQVARRRFAGWFRDDRQVGRRSVGFY